VAHDGGAGFSPAEIAPGRVAISSITPAAEGPGLAVRSALHAPALIIVLALLAGCSKDTKNEVAQQQFATLKAEADGLEAMKNDLIMRGGAKQILEGPDTVSIFLSKNLIDSALKGMAGTKIPVPNVKGATLSIKSVTADLRLGYPLVTVDAEATKKDVARTFEVVATGHLEAGVDPASPSQLTVKVQLDDLVPRAQWDGLDYKVRDFAQNLMDAETLKDLGNLGTIQIPIASDIPLAVEGIHAAVSFPGAQAIVSAPALRVTGHVTVTHTLTLPDGLHVYGVLSAKAGS
jgi:hypothetical protein